ncbi:MAG: cytochrome c biogenesis protein CcsA [Burkholderiaceae bacterium]
MHSGLIALFYGATAALYGTAAWRILASLRTEGERPPLWVTPMLAVALVLHGILLAQVAFVSEHLRFGFALALSVTLWLTVLILWVESFFARIQGLLALMLPVAGIAAILPAVFPGSILPDSSSSVLFRAHLLMAILAYSLLTIAALQALLMAAMDRRLRSEAVGERGVMSFIDRLPPLLAMERVLFRLIGAGFLLLTLTLVTGGFFSEEIFGKPLRFDHKTVLAFAAWIVFAGLLTGRMIFGWRGRVALRWTLTGFAILMLAYIGYRFVIEVLLQRI